MSLASIDPILVERNYYLVERNSETVSLLWLGFQNVFLAVAGISGLVCSYCFYLLKNKMRDNCVLFSKLNFNNTFSSKHTYQINTLLSEWGKDECDYILYEPIVAAVVATVFITLYSICGRGGGGFSGRLPQPWRIVVPSLIANLICSVVSVTVTIYFVNGVDVFCLDLKTYRTTDSKEWCAPIKELYIEDVNVGRYLFEYLSINQIALWLTSMFWGLSFCWVIVRCLCLADFRLVRSTIYDYPGTTEDLINEEFIMREDTDDYVTARSSIDSNASVLEAPPYPN